MQWPNCRDTGRWSWERTWSSKCAMVPFSYYQLLCSKRTQKELSALITLLAIPCFSSIHCFLQYCSPSQTVFWVKKIARQLCHICHSRGAASCRLLRSLHQPEHHIHVLELLLWRSRGEMAHTGLAPQQRGLENPLEFGLRASSPLLHLVVNEALKTSESSTSFASASLNWKRTEGDLSQTFPLCFWPLILNTQGSFF